MKGLGNLPWDCLIKEGDLNNAWVKFNEMLLSVISKHAPLIGKTVLGRDCPCLTPDIRKTIIERDCHPRKAHNSGREVEWSTYRRLRNDTTRRIR